MAEISKIPYIPVIAVTVLVGIIIAIICLIFIKNKSRLLTVVIGIVLIDFAFISSFNMLSLKIKSPADMVYIINPSIIFLLSVFLKILIGFWIIALVVGLFKPERISEFGAKFFGIELSHKYSADMLIIKESQEKLEKQIAIINDLNKEILEYLSGPFEGHIIQTKDKAKTIRQIVKGILTKVYLGSCPQIKIYAIPLNEESIEALNEPLSSIVLNLYLENVDVSTIEKDKIGIGIHHGEEDLGTAIIIDATLQEDYNLILAEICAASSLFVSVSTAIDWALRD